MIPPHRSGGRWTLRYGLAGAEVRKGFLRPLQDSLDGPAGNAEPPSDGLESLPGLADRKHLISVEDAVRGRFPWVRARRSPASYRCVTRCCPRMRHARGSETPQPVARRRDALAPAGGAQKFPLPASWRMSLSRGEVRDDHPKVPVLPLDLLQAL